MAVSDRPWATFTQADYTIGQWRRACLVDTGDGPPDIKARYKVPVREPDGTLNRGGCHAAAGNHGVGAVKGITTAVRAAAAAKLIQIYRDDLGEDPPASLERMASERGADATDEWRQDMAAVVERRFTAVPVEIRGADGTKRIGGYAAKFGTYSRNLGGFVEVIERSFFNKSRGDGWPDVIARYNHDDNMLLGTTAGRTLSLSLDEMGLYYEVEPPQARSDILELVARGDVRKSSFAFRLPASGDEWTLTDQGFPLRKLVTGQLVDVAPVNIPAYEDTSAGLRSLAEHVHADIEEVRKLAEEGELRKFFKRTDTGGSVPIVPAKPKTFGPVALMELLNRKEDPWANA